jgi:hypothetical protein
VLADLLVHQVTVHRRATTATGDVKRDRFGQGVAVNPRVNIADEVDVAVYPCRLSRGTGGMVMQERAVDVFETRYKLYMTLDAAITTEDSVTVTDPLSGLTLLTRAKIVNKSVATDAFGGHHFEFDIWTQSGTS